MHIIKCWVLTPEELLPDDREEPETEAGRDHVSDTYEKYHRRSSVPKYVLTIASPIVPLNNSTLSRYKNVLCHSTHRMA